MNPMKQKVIVIGAGPVGTLAALYAAQRGDEVEIYELRGDPRDSATVPLNFTKSINLALSERGINAMRHAGNPDLLNNVMGETIPMGGRMIHSQNPRGEYVEKAQAYDVFGRSIHAVDRGGLNKRLLDSLEAMPNVTLFFNHKLTGADFKRKKAWVEKSKNGVTTASNSLESDSTLKRAPEFEVDFDFMIGADGAHSMTRHHLMKFARVTFQQEYIDALWCEFRIEPRSSEFALSPNHLHIWPGTHFMFIAIPSLDKSFTCTFFAPQNTFDMLSRNAETYLPVFFATNFPGVTPNLINSKDLINQFSTNPHLPLVTIKCNPYHFQSSAVVLGDAAHAMVPFYGQGMNAGLEDVRILFELFDRYGVYLPNVANREQLREQALVEYTKFRAPDAAAINDLALRNYLEMRSGVVSPFYLFRKYVEESFSKHFPSFGWRTQYSRVSFSNERYSEIIKVVARQGEYLLGATAVLGIGILSAALLGGFGLARSGYPSKWLSSLYERAGW